MPVLILSPFIFTVISWIALIRCLVSIAVAVLVSHCEFPNCCISSQNTGQSLVWLKKELEHYSPYYLGKEELHNVCWGKSNSVSCRCHRAAFCKTVIGCLCSWTSIFCAIQNKSKTIWVQSGTEIIIIIITYKSLNQIFLTFGSATWFCLLLSNT